MASPTATSVLAPMTGSFQQQGTQSDSSHTVYSPRTQAQAQGHLRPPAAPQESALHGQLPQQLWLCLGSRSFFFILVRKQTNLSFPCLPPPLLSLATGFAHKKVSHCVKKLIFCEAASNGRGETTRTCHSQKHLHFSCPSKGIYPGQEVSGPSRLMGNSHR